jgi:hypothetical protein
MERVRREGPEERNKLESLVDAHAKTAERSTNMGNTLSNLAKSYKRLVPQIRGQMDGLWQRMSEFESNKSNSGAWTGSKTTEESGFGGTPGVRWSEFNDLAREVHEVKELIARTPKGTESSKRSSVLGGQIENILHRLGEIESRVSDESFQLNKCVFASEAEVRIWCKDQGVPSCGHFWDLFSVLVVMQPKNQTGKERADENYSSQRTSSTTFENNLGASMSHERPTSLYGKKDGTGDLALLEDGFGACLTYLKWTSGSESFKSRTTGKLKYFCDGVLGSLSGQRGEWVSLARALLSEIKT